MTHSRHAPPPGSVARPILVLVAGLAIAGTAGLLLLSRSGMQPAPPVTSPRPAETAAALPVPAAPVAPAPTRPSFDIVRVDPQGNSVIAGRADPGAKVTVKQGGQALGQAQADDGGNWVLLPETKLAPGTRALTLTERTPQGQDVAGQGAVVLAVPPPPASPAHAAPPVLAVLTQPGHVPQVLQGPAAPTGPARLALGTVDYGEAGRMQFAGTAAPGSTVRLSVDGKAAGSTAAQADGHWVLVPPSRLAPGQHVLHLDQLSAGGRVTASTELPFAQAALPHPLAPGAVVVQPGQSLWLIARHNYGAGIRYTVIYRANQDQIRDPNRIYPGQVFAVPDADTPMPSSSSSSR